MLSPSLAPPLKLSLSLTPPFKLPLSLTPPLKLPLSLILPLSLSQLLPPPPSFPQGDNVSVPLRKKKRSQRSSGPSGATPAPLTRQTQFWPRRPLLLSARRWLREALRLGLNRVGFERPADGICFPANHRVELTNAGDAGRTKVAADQDRLAPTSSPSLSSPLPRTRKTELARAPRDQRRILLLNPPRFAGTPVVRLYRSEYLFVQGNILPPMDLAYFATAARQQARIELLDAQALNLTQQQTYAAIEAFRPEVIVVKGVLSILEHELAAARRFKRRHPEVQLILSCRGALDEEPALFTTFPFLDGIARGEIDAFALDLAEGQPLAQIIGMAVPADAPLPPAVRVVQDLDHVPFPHPETMPAPWYQTYAFPYFGAPSGYCLVGSRGCLFSCAFCQVNGRQGKLFPYRQRNPANIREEIRLLQRRWGLRDLFFFDEILTLDPRASALCEGLLDADLRLTFTCEGKPGHVQRPLLNLMYRAGCQAIFYGIETGDDGILHQMNKGQQLSQCREAILLTQRAGMLAGAYILLGLPAESMRSFWRTVAFLLETRPDMIRYDLLLPYASTPLHALMQQSGLTIPPRRFLDRRTSTRSSVPALHTWHLSPVTLHLLDRLFQEIFAEELCRAPHVLQTQNAPAGRDQP
jgi:anaerobic magnesium-protoporphyrin IX monomethyl ester cyclase